jgi:hypothetical protein
VRDKARPGAGHGDRSSPEERADIGRAIRGMPKVMVEVLSKDSNNLRSVARDGQPDLAAQVGRFAKKMAPAGLRQETAKSRLVDTWRDRRRLAHGQLPSSQLKVIPSFSLTSDSSSIKCLRRKRRKSYLL